ncbi:MAG: hypothetical protein CMN30_04325 [Sandaracinus sp.]|nr:hypothetical protein [Sandaracinus sp.]
MRTLVHPDTTDSCSRARILVILGALAVVGCGDDDGDTPVDMAIPRDAVTVVDAPMADADFAIDQGVAMDMSAPLCPGSCRPDQALGCSGEATCVLEDARPRCAATVGDGELGSACEATDQCAPGFACFQRRTGGVCGRICCRDDATTCEGDEVCRGTGILVDGTATGYGECQQPRTCDVLASPADACELAEACYILSDGETACLAAGDRAAGEACVAANDCAAGYACVGAFEGTCARICRLGRSDCEAVGGTCMAYATSPEGTGLCTPDASAGS